MLLSLTLSGSLRIAEAMRTRRSSAGLRRATLAPWIVPNSAWMLAIRRSSSPPPPSASPWLTLFVFPGRRAEESRLSDVFREYRRFFENENYKAHLCVSSCKSSPLPSKAAHSLGCFSDAGDVSAGLWRCAGGGSEKSIRGAP